MFHHKIEKIFKILGTTRNAQVTVATFYILDRAAAKWKIL
jgi:hypothetical protein